MSGSAVFPSPKQSRPAFSKFLLALGLVCGAIIVAATVVDAQPPGETKGDGHSPLPPAQENQAVEALKYQIPDKDRMIFQGFLNPETGQQVGGIQDFEPIAKETENSDEYRAWHEVVQHAVQFPAAELLEHAARDLTWDDLTGSPRLSNRLHLLRLDGKLTKIRRLAATKSLKDVGITEVYEGIVNPIDEPPTNVISVVFTELPESLAAVRQSPLEQWVDPDVWVSAAGYFFKVKQDAPNDLLMPVLIGKSVVLLKEPGAGNNPTALDKTLRVFKYIRDKAPIAKSAENWEEAAAWNRILLHAHRFTPEELEASARTDLSFADLFRDVRRDYKLDLVKFEGRLISLKKVEPSQKLRDAGIETAYEGWIVPKDEPSGNPICVVFTDPPEGVEPAQRVNKWVSFAGYSFKLLQYESGEKYKDDPKKNVWREAPLLLGRAVINRPDPETASPVSWQSFATIATGIVFTLLAVSLGLSWWYRGGDRRVKSEIAASRTQNPFDAPTN